MSNGFEVDFFSDSRYEELRAEIYFKGQILCQLNKDKGIDSIEIELFSDSRILSEAVEMKFPVNDFLKILMQTKDDLIR
ncbi:hypothetical protein [Enterobacter cancerogenus]|jgi:hypothetical protein|uniref:hypothetical protein n=1 Tax=Enterobacter cancerogenus TaxID=69218 RepID=UPI000734776F|nr:hypothetical protein [Enterobacter cancerogenus]KTQ45300.1 hypothetical protein NS104_21075 [Enterobacter cancerogenus]KTQ52541.1 hypothetical protein NS111_09165 [Enterobacter cancerogenus]KTQ73771.1 hypothetical protein NS188_11095 [Enterobacter cancerogenus]KTQ82918.1 hypothetical protein NS31R_07595 [Enterobacter cancerogenus]MDT7009563.1 hypothetical protein [Enterobacter cancerogenus]